MLTHVVEVFGLPWYQLPSYASHQYSVRLFRKIKWIILRYKATEKYRLGSRGEKKRKEKKLKRNTPLRLHSIDTEEDTLLGNVIL